MFYYFDINKCIVTTVSGVSDSLKQRSTLHLQLVSIYLSRIRPEDPFLLPVLIIIKSAYS